MKKFLIKLSIFILLTLIVFYSTDVIITKGLKKNNSDMFIDWNRIYAGKINADLIINGSSKAMSNISPMILDTLLDVNSYNLGIDGHDFFMQKYKYDIYSNYNNSPNIIIQIVSNGTLNKRNDLYDMAQFLPYLEDSIMQNVTEEYEGLSYLDYSIPLIRYFGYPTIAIKGASSYFQVDVVQKSAKYKGYLSVDREWDSSFDDFVRLNPNGIILDITDVSLQLFKLFIKEQKQKGVTIILVYPPTYIESQKYITNRNDIIDTYRSIASENNLLFLDYSNLFITKNKEFFYNSQHLNKKGTSLFTQILASDIKSLFSSEKQK